MLLRIFLWFVRRDLAHKERRLRGWRLALDRYESAVAQLRASDCGAEGRDLITRLTSHTQQMQRTYTVAAEALARYSNEIHLLSQSVRANRSSA